LSGELLKVDKYDTILYRYFTNLFSKSSPPTSRKNSFFRAARIYSLQTMLLGIELVLSKRQASFEMSASVIMPTFVNVAVWFQNKI